jgi:hypothetical protein
MCGGSSTNCCNDCSCDGGESRFVLSAVSSIVGMLFLGILAILYSINYMDVAWSVTTIDANFVFLLLGAAAVLTFAGIFSLKAGDVTEGILFLFVGVSALMLHGGYFLGYGLPAIGGWILALILFVVVIILLKSRDITFGIAVFIFLVGLLFVAAFESTTVGPMVACIAFLLAGAILLYVAISDWLYVETDADLPIL